MFIHANRHRGNFTMPEMSEYEVQKYQDVGLMIRSAIREAVGVAGLRVFDELNPDFVDDLAATLIEARAEGAWNQQVNDGMKRAADGWAQTGRMLHALLSAPEGEPERDTVLRALGAHAGVDDGSMAALIDNKHSKA